MGNELNVTCMSGSQPWEGRESCEEAQLKTKRPACPARRSPGSPARPGNDVTFLICVDTALIQSSKQQVKDTNCSQTKDKLITRTPNHSWQLCLGFMGFNAEDMRLRKRLWLAAVCMCLVSEWQPLMGNLPMGNSTKIGIFNVSMQCFPTYFRKDCSRLGFSPKRWIGGIFCKVEWPRVQSWVNWKYHNLSFFTTRGNRLILHFAQCSPRDQAGLWYVNRWPGKKEISNITRFWWIHLKKYQIIIFLKCFTTETQISPNKLDVLTWESVNTGVGPFSLNQVFPAMK